MKTIKDFIKDSGRVIFSTQGHNHIRKAQLNLIHIKDVEKLLLDYAREAIKADRENVVKHAKIRLRKLGVVSYTIERTDFASHDLKDGLSASVDKDSIINAPEIELL